MVTVGLVALGLAVGGAAGWWLAREVGRGMPWGFLVLALAVVLLGVAAPFLWPGAVPEVVARMLRAGAGAFVVTATWTVTLAMAERGSPGEEPDPRAEPS